MKIILAISILFAFNSFSQSVNKKIGVSSCSCDSISLDSITTLTRSYHPNGKRAVDTSILISSNCEIGDTARSVYDTLGRTILYQKADYSWNRSYNSTGTLVSETIFLSTDTIHRKFEHLKKGDDLHSTTAYRNDVKQSITRYNGLKATTTYLNENRVDVIKYNKEKRVLSHSIKKRDSDGKKYFFKVDNTFNSHGEMVKSISSENGKQTGIVETYYENGQVVKEVRRILETNTIVTTHYRNE